MRQIKQLVNLRFVLFTYVIFLSGCASIYQSVNVGPKAQLEIENTPYIQWKISSKGVDGCVESYQRVDLDKLLPVDQSSQKHFNIPANKDLFLMASFEERNYSIFKGNTVTTCWSMQLFNPKENATYKAKYISGLSYCSMVLTEVIDGTEVAVAARPLSKPPFPKDFFYGRDHLCEKLSSPSK